MAQSLRAYLVKQKEYYFVSVLFAVLAFLFCYRIFLGEVYSPVNFYYINLPWSAEYSEEGTRGALLSDPVDALYPEIIAVRRALLQGEGIPLWSSHIGLGMPTYETLTALFCPLTWLFYLLPLNLAPTVDFLLRIFLCQLGMFLLLKGFHLRRLPSIIGAVTYTFCMPMVVWLNWPHTKVGMLAPWFLWAVRKLLAGNKRFFIPSALLVSWMFLSGMVTYAIYFYYLVSLYVLCRLAIEYWVNRSMTGVLGKGAAYGSALLFGGLMSMVYVLPFLETARYTGYVGQRMETDIFLRGTWGLNYLLNFFDPVYTADIYAPVHFNELGNYWGILSLFLVAFSFVVIFYFKQSEFYCFMISFIFLMGAVFGLPVFIWLRKLPLLGATYGYRLILPAIFAGTILTAKCMDVLLDKVNTKIWLAGIGCSFVCLLGVFFVGIQHTKPFVWSRNLLVGAIILVVGVCVLFLYQFGKVNKNALAISLLLLVIFDMLHGTINYNPSVAREKSGATPKTVATDYLQEMLGDNRFAALGTWALFPNMASNYGLNDFAAHSMLMPGNRLRDYYTAIDGNAYQSSTRVKLTAVQNYAFLSLSSIKYILSPFPITSGDVVSENYSATQREPLGEITSGVIAEQTFAAEQPNLYAISIFTATYTKLLEQGSLSYQVKDASGAVVREGSVPNAQIEDNALYTFSFEPIADSQGKHYTLSLFSKDSVPGHAPTVWIYDCDQYPFGSLILNGEDTGRDMVFHPYYFPDWLIETLETKSGMFVYENKNTMPRAYLTGNVTVIEDPDILLNTMLHTRDLTAAYTEQVPPFATMGDGVEQVQNLNISPNSVTMETNSIENKLLVLTDLNYPGWAAYVDGVKSEIFQTNYLFRGVFIPRGSHTVRFVFRPWSLYVGLIVSATAFVLMIFCRLWLVRKDKDKKRPLLPGDLL